MNRLGKSPRTAGVKKMTHELQGSGSIAYSPFAPTILWARQPRQMRCR
jgi:hypothetical protein